jgi:hypothetical protein
VTKRRELLKKIRKAAQQRGFAWSAVREGANHTVFDLDGVMIPVARHNEIDNRMAEIIYRECAAKLGKDWWKK